MELKRKKLVFINCNAFGYLLSRTPYNVTPYLAVEVEGGIWNYGRHNRASTFIKDMEKYNNACLLGWNLLRLSTDMVKNGEGVIYILKFFRGDNYIE